MELKLTPEQVWNIMVYGTAAILLMVFGLIALVLYFNHKNRKYAQELEELRQQHTEHKNSEIVFITKSRGKDDVHVMD